MPTTCMNLAVGYDVDCTYVHEHQVLQTGICMNLVTALSTALKFESRSEVILVLLLGLSGDACLLAENQSRSREYR